MGSIDIAQLPKVSLFEMLKLVALPSEKEDVAEIVGRAGELVRTVVPIIDDLISFTIEKRTAEDFVRARNETYPQYFMVMRALGDLGRIVIPKQIMERLSAEWFSEMEADFRELGPSAFGSDLGNNLLTIPRCARLKKAKGRQ